MTPPPDTPGQTQPQKFPWPALFGGLAAALLTAGQYFLRLVLRKKRLAAGTPNARALARWQQVLRYRKALKCKPPSELLELAEKARFSRHTLTDEELAQFDSYLAKAKLELKKQKLPKRIFWQLLLAIE